MTTWELQAKIHNEIKSNVSPGMKETDIADVITSVCPHWRGDLISGARSACVEGGPTDRTIATGDVILFDIQVYSERMWSDITRVYFVGEPNDKQVQAYKKIADAIKAGERLLRPGTKGKELYDSMRSVIGTDYAFAHHAGHLLSPENAYIKPAFEKNTEDELVSGVVAAIEPGIYYPGEFGIRLENNYRITEKGFERLDNLSLEISDYILKG